MHLFQEDLLSYADSLVLKINHEEQFKYMRVLRDDEDIYRKNASVLNQYVLYQLSFLWIWMCYDRVGRLYK